MVAAAALAILGIVAYAVANETPVERAEAIPPVSIPDPLEVYDPVRAGETLPEGYRSALPRDAILPVYEPAFTEANNVDWPGDSLVIGVSGATESKAYPVTHMNSREMVVDSLEGIPILVTW